MKLKKCLKWLLLRWKLCLWVLAVVISLGIFGLLVRGDQKTIATLTHQQAAQNWGTEEKPYSQATVFLPAENAVPTDSVAQIRNEVEKAMLGASVAASEYPWLYAFSCNRQGELKNGIASSNVTVTMIAGDYFTIHPLPVRYGWYLDESEVMRDRIVLDRQAAWDLFYSDNVVGQFLEWNGQRYMVAAVVDTEPGKYNELAAEGTRRAWVFADSPGADPNPGFTCLEMVLPQPVKGFAVSTMASVLESYLPKGTAPLDNTGRFSLINRWNALKEISVRWISSQAISYPYYENAARLVENHLALRLIPEGIFLGFPCISLIVWLLMLNARRTWGLKSISRAVERAVERKRTRDYEAKLRGDTKKKKSFPVKRRRNHARGSLDFSGGKYGKTKFRR